MRIGLDLDGVVYPWSDVVREILQSWGYPDIGPSTHWNYIKDQIRKEDWARLWNGRWAPLSFEQDDEYRGAGPFMRRLAEDHELVIITHRPKFCAAATARWLGARDVNCRELHVLQGEDKSTVRPVCDLYIDDKPEVCDDYIFNTPTSVVFCPNRPWNETYQPMSTVLSKDRFHRYDNFKEVLEWVQSQTT